MGYGLLSFATPDELCHAVAVRWHEQLVEAHRNGQLLSVALSGGRIARNFLALAARTFTQREASLDPLHVFWGDERCVPPQDAESNFRLFEEAFLSTASLSPHQVHRIPGELDPGMAAVEAEKDLRCALPTPASGWPVLDLVFLGMGEDGHVASLFPGASEEVVHSQAVFVPVTGPKPPPRRVSLTYGMITSAREVWVLASGSGKEEALRRSLSAEGDTPLARVLQSRNQSLIFTDIPGF